MKIFRYCLLLLLSLGLNAQEQEDQGLEVFKVKPARKSRGVRHEGGNEVVRIGSDFTLETNETARSVVVIGGNATIEGETDEVVVISGSLKVNGTVHRSAVTIMGKADVGPNAKISREMVVVGGPLKVAPGATMGRKPVQVGFNYMFPKIERFNRWFASGFLLARPLPLVAWAWLVAGVFLLFYLLIAALFPQPVAACVKSLHDRPASSLLAGILAFVLFGPLCLLLAVSMIGIPAIPVLVCCLLIALPFGKTAFLQFIGERVTGASPGLSPLVQLLIGGLVLGVVYMVPVLGFMVVALSTLLGLGAALIAIGNSLKKERPATPAIPIPPAGATIAPPLVSAPAEALMPQPLAEVVYYDRAGFWIRLCASMLDLILISGLGLLIGPFAILVMLVYHIAMWTWKGSTIGGIVLSLKVVRLDGQPINFSIALVRGLASFFSFIVFFLGFFWAGWDREKQSWHDKIAGTVIVKAPKGVSLI